MNQRHKAFKPLRNQFGSVISQPQGAHAEAILHLEAFIQNILDHIAEAHSDKEQRFLYREVLLLLYGWTIARTGCTQGFLIADPNHDGVPELFWINAGQLWVLSPVGGRLLYWIDLSTGQVRGNPLLNVLDAEAGNPSVTKKTRGVIHDVYREQITPDQVVPLISSDVRYHYTFREQRIQFQYQGTRLKLTKTLIYETAIQQFLLAYELYNPTAGPLHVVFQVKNECHLDVVLVQSPFEAVGLPDVCDLLLAPGDTQTLEIAILA